MKTRLKAVISLLSVLCGLGLGWPANAAESEITIRSSAMRKMLMDQLFVDRGRYFLLRQSQCQFAYLESPVVAVAVGRVAIKARLTVHLGGEADGRCAGAGESFDVIVSARPYFSGENIGLTDIRIDDISNEFYRMLPEMEGKYNF